MLYWKLFQFQILHPFSEYGWQGAQDLEQSSKWDSLEDIEIQSEGILSAAKIIGHFLREPESSVQLYEQLLKGYCDVWSPWGEIILYDSKCR